MKTVELRLNEILTIENTPLINIDLPDVNTPFERDPIVCKFLYDLVVDNYRWAFIIPESTEAFKRWFQTIWNRKILHYLPIIVKQWEMYDNLYTGRKEVYHRDRKIVDKPDETHDTTLTLGDKTTSVVNREYVRTPKLTTTNNQTQYEQLVVNSTENRNGTETNTTKTVGDGDIVSRSGKNETKFTKTGTNNNDLTDDSTNTTTEYDFEKLKGIASQINILDTWVDEFSCLFNPILAIG